jgi:hypothetical protein
MKESLPTRAITKTGKKGYLTIQEEEALCLYVSSKCKDFENAMIQAGYPVNRARKEWYKLSKTKKAKDFLSKKINDALKLYNKNADDVLQEIALIAFSDPGNLFIKADKSGVALKNILEMGPERRAIKKIKHTQRITDLGKSNGEGDAPKLVENVYEYEMWSKPDALKVLAEHHKIIGAQNNGGGNTVILPLLYLPDNGRNKPGPVA